MAEFFMFKTTRDNFFRGLLVYLSTRLLAEFFILHVFLCKNHPFHSAISVFGKRKSAVFLHVSFFLFTFAPCLYALTGKTGYVCCVGGRRTEVPHASQDIMD